MRSTYWTCSKFADWLRGTAKPEAETSKGWAQWKRQAKTAHPIRYWIADEALDFAQNVWCWIPERINDIRYYINNRWITRSHSLTAHSRDIKPGSWCDVGNRFLPCLFNELVDFVEVEQAWHHVMWNDEVREKYRTPWTRTFFRFRTWRCAEAGLDYLKWASTLTNKEFIKEGEKEESTYQAKAAKEILELYTWWKEVYPNRPDPYVVSGWSAICDRRREKYPDEILPEDETKKERAESKKALDIINKMEAQYKKEDEQMMIRLIKIRDSLWT